MGRTLHRFQAVIYRIWMMRHIDVPDDIARALLEELARGGGRNAKHSETKPKLKYIPVVATVNGKLARTTLVPAGGGRFRMQINTPLRKAAQADVGDLVGVELHIDGESRELSVPADLKAGLKQHPTAWKAYQELGPGQRRHFIHWFDSAKSVEARDRRLNRAIDFLLERALLGPRRSKRPRTRR